MNIAAKTTATEAKFCFDKAWAGGQSPDREALEAFVEDFVDGVNGRGVIEGEGENITLTIIGNFTTADMTRMESELAELAMRKEACA